MAMCSAFGSRIASSRRSALGQTDTNLADVRESPLANKVTSWPSVSSSSVSQWMTRSVPPYSFGGMASVNGAICAMCTGETSIAETPTHDVPGYQMSIGRCTDKQTIQHCRHYRQKDY